MSQGRYVWIAGKKVYLNPELQKEWDKLINKERYRARQEKICGQADYRRCNGDASGKSTLVSQIGLAAVSQGYKVALFSGEMTAYRIMQYKQRLDELRIFFQSGRFVLLTDIDGIQLLKRLEREIA